jgi:hypothetical protein
VCSRAAKNHEDFAPDKTTEDVPVGRRVLAQEEKQQIVHEVFPPARRHAGFWTLLFRCGLISS